MCYDSSTTCVDGWSVKCDTAFFTSFIEPIDSNRIVIQFSNGTLGKDNKGDSIEQNFSPILLLDGELDFPEYESKNLRYFNGYFVGHDTIKMNFRYGLGGIGIYTNYEITGIRQE